MHKLDSSWKLMDIMEKIHTPDPSWNWLTILKDLAAGAPLSEERFWELRLRGARWPTCACGQLCQALPRTPIGEPLDSRLASLGLDFCVAINHKEWRHALSFFHQIEERTGELLEQQMREVESLCARP